MSDDHTDITIIKTTVCSYISISTITRFMEYVSDVFVHVNVPIML